MDSKTIIAAVVFILICVLLIRFMGRNKKKLDSQFLKSLFGLAEKNNCKISKYDRWNNSIIGIDEGALHIFIISKINEVEN